jgi:replicative DNA helicase
MTEIIDYYENLEKEIEEGLDQEQISMGFERLNFHVGLRKATYYLIGGYTGSGKTSFLDDAFVLNPFDFVHSDKNTKEIKLKIFYFSMERRKNYKLGKFISRKIFLDTGKIISVNKILGWVSEEYKLTKDEHDIVKSYKDYINFMLNDCITIIENPQNPMGIKKVIDKYAEENGKFEQIDKHNKIYLPNNPKEHVIVIYDHIGLQKKETRKYPNGDIVRLSTKKEIIDQSSEDARKFRDVYGYSIVKVSQFNRDIANPTRIKNGDVEPMLEDFKDSGSTQEDAQVVFALFDPMRYKVPDPSGYNLDKLRNDYGAKMYRSVKLLKNSYGSDDVRIGLAFQPVIGMFREMPKIQDTTEKTYNSIKDNSFFREKPLIPMSLALKI